MLRYKYHWAVTKRFQQNWTILLQNMIRSCIVVHEMKKNAEKVPSTNNANYNAFFSLSHSHRQPKFILSCRYCCCCCRHCLSFYFVYFCYQNKTETQHTWFVFFFEQVNFRFKETWELECTWHTNKSAYKYKFSTSD